MAAPPQPATPPLRFDGPARASAKLILTHGAGAPVDDAFFESLVTLLVERGVRVARFEFPYMQKRRRDGKRRGPDRAPVLQASWRAVAAELGCESVEWGAIPETAYHLLVNCTPVGGGEGDGSPIPAEWIRPGCLALDAVYRPIRTPFLRAVGAAGGVPIPGATERLDDAEVIECALALGLPVMVKASAGGGPRTAAGPLLVQRKASVPDALLL